MGDAGAPSKQQGPQSPGDVTHLQDQEAFDVGPREALLRILWKYQQRRAGKAH